MNSDVIELNKAATRRIYDEVINQAMYEKAAELFSDKVSDTEKSRGFSNIDSNGVHGMVRLFKTLRAAFPDHHIEIKGLIAEGDRVVAHVETTGTHQGELLSVPGTGKRVKYVGIDIFQFKNGKVIKHWGATDMLGFLTQIGAWAPQG